ncbi:MAG TPA: chaperone modulator CbpM [Burkholderiales bacterium]|nr:chaperone modulator CbpM [Burkholderiales bacterium]
MTGKEIREAEILQEACLTLEQLCAAAALERDWLIRHVEEGLIPVAGTVVAEWRFTTVHLRRAKRMHEIERTYDAEPELAGLVADMLEELDDLRALLRRHGLA